MNITRKKVKTAFFCTKCGAEHTRWQGQCRECGEWNTLVEERIVTPAKSTSSKIAAAAQKARLAEISGESLVGLKSGIEEFDRVLGGYLLAGMTVLLGGDPGIGKSTLVLQAAEAYSRIGVDVLYLTGEESPAQLKQRANRLGVTGERITVVNTTALEEIIALLNDSSYGIVIVDSIQTVATSAFDSPPGTVGQVRESAQQLISLSKSSGFALLLVGHVTKEGMVAGPKVLEHMVDTVLYFDGDSQHLYRILRAVKNRFGSVAEIGLFEMAPQGLIEVANPSSLFLSGDLQSERTGSAVCAIVEGNRPIMVEVQALVANANYGTPQRVAGGMDQKRLALLLAILEKRCGLPMATNDVFVSVAGGLRLSEPAIDLALCIAIASSHINRPLAATTVVIGEVGLSGEVRRVSLIERRLKEAMRLGFTHAVIPDANAGQLETEGIEVMPVKSVADALELTLR